MAKRGRPKHPRPAGWSKEFVLQWLELHPKGNIMPMLERLAKDEPGILAGTLYQEIARWKKTDPEFRAAYKEAMDGRHPIANNEYAEVLALEHRGSDMEDWRLTAAMMYLESKSKATAAKAAGISISHLYGKLREGSPDADPELIHLFRQVETIMLWGKEETLEWAVQEARDQGDARTAGQLALSVLERLDKRKWSKSEERVVSGHIVHEHVVQARKESALAAAAMTSRKLFGPREEHGALPEHREPVDVVDAEYECEEVPVAAEG